MSKSQTFAEHKGSCACGKHQAATLVDPDSFSVTLLHIAGKVQLLATGEPILQSYCHCSSCRRYQSAPFVATVLFKTSNISFVSGENEVMIHHNALGCRAPHAADL